jgi:myosin heavy subunit
MPLATSTALMSDSALTKRIKADFEQNQTFNSLSYNVLVSLNPFKSVGNENSLKEAMLSAYGNSNGDDLVPHIYTTALYAYHRMVSLSEDQVLTTL